MRRKWFSATLVWLGLAFCGVILAQDSETPEPILRLNIDPQEAVLVGQPVRLYVDVLVPTWLSRAPEFPTLEIPGAIVVGPEERATNLTEPVDGQNWFGLRRSYLVYPQEPRQYEIPAEEVVVHYSLGGAKSATVGLPIPSQTFVARIPSEAAWIGYFIATTRLDLTQQLDPSVEGLRVGDSLRRTISISADQTFAMFLPPIEFESIEGLAVYPDQPQVVDKSADREGFKEGRRVESVSYVIQTSGRYQLPGVTIFWWDLNAGRLREATLRPISFEAVANPEYVSELAPPVEKEPAGAAVKEETLFDSLKRSAIPIVLGLGLMAVVALVLRRMVPRFREWWNRRRREQAENQVPLPPLNPV